MGQLLGSNRNQLEFFCLESAMDSLVSLGTIKRQWGYDYTLMKGINKVSGEWAIIFWVYNLRRSLTILGEKELRKRLKEAADYFFSTIKANFKPFTAFVFEKGISIQGKIKKLIHLQIQAMSLSGVLIF